MTVGHCTARKRSRIECRNVCNWQAGKNQAVSLLASAETNRALCVPFDAHDHAFSTSFDIKNVAHVRMTFPREIWITHKLLILIHFPMVNVS
jgi:hypothetical protein